MRWTKEPRSEWRWRFALFPLAIGDRIVWLEWVQCKHKTEDAGTWAGGGHGYTIYRDRAGAMLGRVKVQY